MLNFLDTARYSAKKAGIPLKKSTELWLAGGNLVIFTPVDSPHTEAERKQLKEWKRIRKQLEIKTLFFRHDSVEWEAIKAALDRISELMTHQEQEQAQRRELATLNVGLYAEAIPSFYGFQQLEPVAKIRLLRFIKILKASAQACEGDLTIELNSSGSIRITSPYKRPAFKVVLRPADGFIGGLG